MYGLLPISHLVKIQDFMKFVKFDFQDIITPAGIITDIYIQQNFKKDKNMRAPQRVE